MNNGEIFEQRWEFRRGEVDGDTSSDENRSNSTHGQANRSRNLVTDLVLVENDEASDDPECQMRDNKLEETKNESNKSKKKKKQGLQKKKSEGHAVNENKRKRKLKNNETVTLKDLKIYANSLIHELSVTRENMFAHMREEMQKLVSNSKSNLLPIKKNVRRSQKKKESKPQNVEGNGASDVRKFANAVAENEKNEPRRTNKQQKDEKLRPSAMVHMNHQPVSSSNTHLPKPQFQIQRNGFHLNDHIPQGVPKNNSSGPEEIEIGKLMAAKRFAEFQHEERLRSFSHNHQKSTVGLLCPSSSRPSFIQSIGVPIPIIQGMSNGSNTSSLTYCENSFVDNSGVGVRMNGSIARFPRWS